MRLPFLTVTIIGALALCGCETRTDGKAPVVMYDVPGGKVSAVNEKAAPRKPAESAATVEQVKALTELRVARKKQERQSMPFTFPQPEQPALPPQLRSELALAAPLHPLLQEQLQVQAEVEPEPAPNYEGPPDTEQPAPLTFMPFEQSAPELLSQPQPQISPPEAIRQAEQIAPPQPSPPVPAEQPSPEAEVSEAAYVPALDARKVQADMVAVFRELDRYPLLSTSLAPLERWADPRGRCGVSFTRGAQLTLGTVDFSVQSFPVMEAVPVDCAQLDQAYKAAVMAGTFGNVGKLEKGDGSAMGFVSQKRDALKRDFTKAMLDSNGKTSWVKAHGLGADSS